VLRIAANGHALLLSGDLDADGERQLLSRWPAASLASDVVVVGRGAGSRSSSTEWIEAGSARLAIAAGGHRGSVSRAQTLARWRRSGVVVLDQFREGDVEIGLGMQGFAVLGTARAARHPFAWRRLP
jgi:competence protein ComEC